MPNPLTTSDAKNLTNRSIQRIHLKNMLKKGRISTDTGWMKAKETVKGLPATAKKVAGSIAKSTFLRGLPSTESLKKGVEKMKELRGKNLPRNIYYEGMKKIIESL